MNKRFIRLVCLVQNVSGVGGGGCEDLLNVGGRKPPRASKNTPGWERRWPVSCGLRAKFQVRTEIWATNCSSTVAKLWLLTPGANSCKRKIWTGQAEGCHGSIGFALLRWKKHLNFLTDIWCFHTIVVENGFIFQTQSSRVEGTRRDFSPTQLETIRTVIVVMKTTLIAVDVTASSGDKVPWCHHWHHWHTTISNDTSFFSLSKVKQRELQLPSARVPD